MAVLASSLVCVHLKCFSPFFPRGFFLPQILPPLPCSLTTTCRVAPPPPAPTTLASSWCSSAFLLLDFLFFLSPSNLLPFLMSPLSSFSSLSLHSVFALPLRSSLPPPPLTPSLFSLGSKSILVSSAFSSLPSHQIDFLNPFSSSLCSPLPFSRKERSGCLFFSSARVGRFSLPSTSFSPSRHVGRRAFCTKGKETSTDPYFSPCIICIYTSDGCTLCEKALFHITRLLSALDLSYTIVPVISPSFRISHHDVLKDSSLSPSSKEKLHLLNRNIVSPIRALSSSVAIYKDPLPSPSFPPSSQSATASSSSSARESQGVLIELFNLSNHSELRTRAAAGREDSYSLNQGKGDISELSLDERIVLSSSSRLREFIPVITVNGKVVSKLRVHTPEIREAVLTCLAEEEKKRHSLPPSS
ncbi:hypothetical protein CSUI_011241 [Cystoisospora suis]|uniref:Uncharacterized protein n=1 Tax=Cystoisospora suis TaxID=483139 RepID=A0A2C6KA20_9APIC|nr:hypothetical protein CSUI_011241 [Cystoisospora suis]